DIAIMSESVFGKEDISSAIAMAGQEGEKENSLFHALFCKNLMEIAGGETVEIEEEKDSDVFDESQLPVDMALGGFYKPEIAELQSIDESQSLLQQESREDVSFKIAEPATFEKIDPHVPTVQQPVDSVDSMVKPMAKPMVKPTVMPEAEERVEKTDFLEQRIAENLEADRKEVSGSKERRPKTTVELPPKQIESTYRPQAGQVSGVETKGVPNTEIPEPYSQINDEIHTRLSQKGPMEFSMQLEPKDLGKIDVKLKIYGGKLIIDIVSANPKTHVLLAGQTEKLITSMGLRNVSVENVQINQPSDAQNHSNDFFQDSSNQQQWNRHKTPVFKNMDRQDVESDPSNAAEAYNVRAQRNSFVKMDYVI
ncbi:MAG TPA: flagellar hook-length control protein FliK, partial [Anaerovoracaceae bacterium]|nr:flagellar hook-length control protein FliK [Anaerovoracaceae bacterium]